MIISWVAVFLLALSYWFQIWKIHVHKEVRDLSIPYHVLLVIGFSLLTFQAYVEDSTIFLVKQILVIVPVSIIIGQILYHRDDKWHDDEDKFCCCDHEIEQDWIRCPYCDCDCIEELRGKDNEQEEVRPNLP